MKRNHRNRRHWINVVAITADSNGIINMVDDADDDDDEDDGADDDGVSDFDGVVGVRYCGGGWAIIWCSIRL